MRLYLRLFLLVGLAGLSSCSNTTADKDTKKMPQIDSTLTYFSIMAPDSISVDSEYCAKICLKDSKLKLLNVYVDCDNDDFKVDTANNGLVNCKKKLLIQNDTAFFCLTSIAPKQINYHLTALADLRKGKYIVGLIRLKASVYKKTNR